MPSSRSTAPESAQSGYMLCTSPRSGSTLLCTMLAAAKAGAPCSLFYESTVDGWADRLGLLGPVDSPHFLRDLFAAAIPRGKGKTDIFGFRQQCHSLDALCKAMERAYPAGQTDLDRLRLAFGPLKVIYLKRLDKVEQAVSYLRAEVSGLWHLGADGQEIERNAPEREEIYDADAIAEKAMQFRAYDLHWQGWFAKVGVAPLEVLYEDLASDPHAVLESVLAYLGLSSDCAQKIPVPLTKLADSTSQTWIDRFRSDRPDLE